MALSSLFLGPTAESAPPRPQLALQRHAFAVEALERRSLAEALLEREYAIFKRALVDGF